RLVIMNTNGEFSLTLKTLRLQLATLMENVGGRDAQILLDQLAELEPDQRQILLNLFMRVVTKLKAEDLVTLAASSEFEDQLTEGILADFKLLVFPEANNTSEDNVVDLEVFRKSRNIPRD
ncbi:MAG: hypothetical protein WD512_17520, partial [Candidatus Paceibacterota bacterium]